MDELHKVISRYKNDKICQNGFNLELNDISTKEVIPNTNLFTAYTSNETTPTNEPKPNETTPTNKLRIKNKKSKHKILSTEKFYINGVISKTFFKKKEISLTSDKIYSGSKKSVLKELSVAACDHNWLLSLCVFLQFVSSDAMIKSKHAFNKSREIKLLITGLGNGGFISGMYHYFYNSALSKNSNILRQYNIDWIGIDSKTYDTMFEKILKHKLHGENIINGISNDNVLEPRNISLVETIIDNRCNAVNMIFNNIKPKMTDGKNKILISVGILAIKSLSKSGIMITKILEPEYWHTEFFNYIMLFALMFQQTSIFRFPVCKNNKSYFKYYLVGEFRKKLLFDDILVKKLYYILSTDVQLKLSNEITESEEMRLWKDNIMLLKQQYTEESNPNDKIHHIINELREIL